MEYVKLVTKDRVFFMLGLEVLPLTGMCKALFWGEGGLLGIDKALYRFKLTIHN